MLVCGIMWARGILCDQTAALYVLAAKSPLALSYEESAGSSRGDTGKYRVWMTEDKIGEDLFNRRLQRCV
jgi:hypothetical protein